MLPEVVPIISLLSTIGHPRARTNIVELEWLTYKFYNERPSDGGDLYLLCTFKIFNVIFIIYFHEL